MAVTTHFCLFLYLSRNRVLNIYNKILNLRFKLSYYIPHKKFSDNI